MTLILHRPQAPRGEHVRGYGCHHRRGTRKPGTYSCRYCNPSRWKTPPPFDRFLREGRAA